MIIGLFLMICFVAVAIIAIGTSIIHGILNFILGLFGRFRSPHGRTGQSHQSGQQSNHTTASGGKKKVFDKDDGEYVDFEEIKE